VIGSVVFPLVILALPFLRDGNPDSVAICGADSRESVFARSLSESQLRTLYADSMKILASTDRARTYENGHFPEQFAYLKPVRIKVRPMGQYSYVSFTLKGCLDEFIHLSVEGGKIVLTYSTGGASSRGEEVLWEAHREVPSDR
jgi:hypothetical protein